MATDPLAPRTVRPDRVSRILADLLGPIGNGNRFGSELAIDDIRFAEAMTGVPLADRLPRQPREET